MNRKIFKKRICIIGLGYVGLPLAIEFGKKYDTLAYDINSSRINQLNKKIDITNEIKLSDFKLSKKIFFTNCFKDLKNIDIFIVTVPTPIDKKNKPNFNNLIKASKLIGNIIKKKSIVVYESTVYPGATEEICIPTIEKYSGFKLNKDFFCGYSPERINPGKSKYKLTNIKKIISASNKKTLNTINELYKSIIIAGTYKVSEIKIAEAAKIIENCQRDINIAFVNELSVIFNIMNINTYDVLKAASTKWNFLNFEPGLVGGHCIGVDPYYLAEKARILGYNSKIILAGRSLNTRMGDYVSKNVLKEIKLKKPNLTKPKILIMGFSFKENCNDVRNTRVVDIYKYLTKKDCKVDIYDPIVSSENVKKLYKINLIDKIKTKYYDAIIIAVGHKSFSMLSQKKLMSLVKKPEIIFDLKNIFKNKFPTKTL